MEQLQNFLQASKDRKENPAIGTPIGKCLPEVFDRMSKLSTMNENIPGLSTGIPALDDMTGGLEPGELIAVKGIRDVGVTSFLTNIALRAAKATRRPVLFFSREESAMQLTRRFLSSESQVSINRMDKGKLTDTEWQILAMASRILTDADIRIFDKAGNIDEITNICAQFNIPCLIIVDQLPEEEADPLCQMYYLKQLALKKQTPILCSCWFHDMSHYAYSGTDKVLWIERNAALGPYYDESKAVCRVERNTYGKNGQVDLYWDPETLTFVSAYPTQVCDISLENNDV